MASGYGVVAPITPTHFSNIGKSLVTGAVAPGTDYDFYQWSPIVFCNNAASNKSSNLTLEDSTSQPTHHVHIVVWDGFGDVVLLAQGTDTINGSASVTFSGTAGDERTTILMIVGNGGGAYKAGSFHAEGNLVPSAVSPNVQLSADLEIDAGHDTAGALAFANTAGHVFGTQGASSIALGDVTGPIGEDEIAIGDGAASNVVGALTLNSREGMFTFYSCQKSLFFNIGALTLYLILTSSPFYIL